MWISRKKWNFICRKIELIERQLQEEKEYTDKKIYDIEKKILRQPEELSKEIADLESIDKFISDFIQT